MGPPATKFEVKIVLSVPPRARHCGGGRLRRGLPGRLGGGHDNCDRGDKHGPANARNPLHISPTSNWDVRRHRPNRSHISRPWAPNDALAPASTGFLRRRPSVIDSIASNHDCEYAEQLTTRSA